MNVIAQKRDLLVFALICVISLHWWQRNQIIDMDWIFDYWSYYPNSHRLFSQLLLFMHDNPIHFVNLVTITIIISMFATYKTLNLSNESLLLFLFCLGWMVANDYFVHCMPIYPILAYLVTEKDWRVVPLLVFFKEHAVLLALLYLFTTDKKRESLYALTGSACIYALIFALVPYVGYSPYGDAIPTFFYAAKMLTIGTRWILTEVVALVFVVLMLYPFTRQEKILLVANVLFVLIFGLFWEFQLWMTIFVIVLARKQYEEVGTS